MTSAYWLANGDISPTGEYFLKTTSPSLSVKISSGSPSRMRMVRRISFGMTTRPRSSILLTIPVAFIGSFLRMILSKPVTCTARTISCIVFVSRQNLYGKFLNAGLDYFVFAFRPIHAAKRRRPFGSLRRFACVFIKGGYRPLSSASLICIVKVLSRRFSTRRMVSVTVSPTLCLESSPRNSP